MVRRHRAVREPRGMVLGTAGGRYDEENHNEQGAEQEHGRSVTHWAAGLRRGAANAGVQKSRYPASMAHVTSEIATYSVVPYSTITSHEPSALATEPGRTVSMKERIPITVNT